MESQREIREPPSGTNHKSPNAPAGGIRGIQKRNAGRANVGRDQMKWRTARREGRAGHRSETSAGTHIEGRNAAVGVAGIKVTAEGQKSSRSAGRATNAERRSLQRNECPIFPIHYKEVDGIAIRIRHVQRTAIRRLGCKAHSQNIGAIGRAWV
jgi:hypothetical protein